MPTDVEQAALTLLGAHLAVLADAAGSIPEALAKMSASLDQFVAVVRAGKVPAGGGAEAVGSAVGYNWNELGRDMSALVRATVAIASHTVGPQAANVGGAGLTWANSAAPAAPPAPTPPRHWLWDTLGKLKKGAGRAAGSLGRGLVDRNAMRVLKRSGLGRAAGGGLRAGAQAAAGRGALGGVLAGGRAGAILGGAGGPVGMVVGAVAGMAASAAKVVFDQASGLFNVLAGSLVRVLSPVAILSRAIQSSTSGYGVLGKSVDVLASIIGTALLPLFLSLSAAVLTVATMIQGPMMDAARQLTGPVLHGTMEALALFIAGLETATEYLAAFAGVLQGIVNLPLLRAIAAGMGSDTGAAKGAANSMTGGLIDRYESRRQQLGLTERKPGADGKPAGPGQESGRELFASSLRLAIGEFKRQIGGKAERVGFEDISGRAQLAAIGTSPLDQKILEAQLKALTVAERMLGELEEANRKKPDL